MADAATRQPVATGSAADGDRLYILDARNAVERRILLDWVHATADDAAPQAAPQAVSLSISDGDQALPLDVLEPRVTAWIEQGGVR